MAGHTLFVEIYQQGDKYIEQLGAPSQAIFNKINTSSMDFFYLFTQLDLI